MTSGEGGGGEPTNGNSFDNDFLTFIKAVGEARVALGPDTGERATLNNEFQNVRRAVEEDHIVDFKAGTDAMHKIAEQAREIKAKGGRV